MRAGGGCTLHQALTTEAATLVKQSVSLARRRGHTQVTPLHVASTMLSSSAGLLRAACLRSNSHPLQCKALELCFNVSLNRIPASTTTSCHHHFLRPPTLSNALVAVFKRAQAHQRRGGSAESQQQHQQQPLLAAKIEIEQLVISILDDPSVSRVMREAGFNSTQVKGNVDHQALSYDFEISSSTANLKGPNREEDQEDRGHLQLKMNRSSADDQYRPSRKDQDVKSVMDCLIGRKKRSIAVVGECLSKAESVITEMMNRVERGDVPDILKCIQFVTLPLFSFFNLSRNDVEQKIGELRCLVDSCFVSSGGVVLYLEDLKWVAEYRAERFTNDRHRDHSMMNGGYYCPVEHVIMELGRMIRSTEERRFWFMGIATYETYMRCRAGDPSIESIWCLHPLTVPVGSLGLSLSHDSYLRSLLSRRKRSDEEGSQWSWYDHEVEDSIIVRTPCFPSWLQQCKETTNNNNSNHQINRFSTSVLYSSNSDQEGSKEYHKINSSSTTDDDDDYDSTNKSMEMKYICKEVNDRENLKNLRMALEKKVPRQLVDITPEISTTIRFLQCRPSGGMMKRRRSENNNSARRGDAWLSLAPPPHPSTSHTDVEVSGKI